eukprot:4483268-Amphidinium_carterae.1
MIQRWIAGLDSRKTGVPQNGSSEPKPRSEDRTETLEITVAKLTWSRGAFYWVCRCLASAKPSGNA